MCAGVCGLQAGLKEKKDTSRKQIKEQKNRGKKVRGTGRRLARHKAKKANKGKLHVNIGCHVSRSGWSVCGLRVDVIPGVVCSCLQVNCADSCSASCLGLALLVRLHVVVVWMDSCAIDSHLCYDRRQGGDMTQGQAKIVCNSCELRHSAVPEGSHSAVKED